MSWDHFNEPMEQSFAGLNLFYIFNKVFLINEKKMIGIDVLFMAFSLVDAIACAVLASDYDKPLYSIFFNIEAFIVCSVIKLFSNIFLNLKKYLNVSKCTGNSLRLCYLIWY